MLTTKNNPGAFSFYPKTTFRKLGSNGLKRLKDGNVKSFINGLLSESSNMINQQSKASKYYCNLCKKESPYFANLSNRLRIKWHAVCPNCNSRKRHRGLKVLYETMIKQMGEISALHFAPEPVLFSVLQQPNVDYKTTDYLLKDVDYPKVDIQQIEFDSNSFDLILCNHVIEHVPEDEKAMSEISRILSPKGYAIFTIPGNMKRKETVSFKDLSFNGHYRDYGIDVIKKFEKYFNSVNPIDLFIYNNNYHLPLGLSKFTDLAFVCKN